MKLSKRLMVLMCVFVFMTAALSIAAADEVLASEAEIQLLGFMEQIAEDIEEIHHDMHTVAFALRLSAYSQAAIAVILLLMLLVKAASYRKRKCFYCSFAELLQRSNTYVTGKG